MSQELNFNIFNILIISGTIQGLLFGLIVLLFKKYRLTPNFYLAQVIIYLSLNNLYYWFLDTNIFNRYPLYEYLYTPWILLVLPMYYFFVKTYLNLPLTKKDKFYFLSPFFISLSIHLFLMADKLLLFRNAKAYLDIQYYLYYTEELSSIIFTCIIIFKAFKLIKKEEVNSKVYSKNNIPSNTKWLKQILYFGILICLIWLLIVVFSPVSKSSYNNNDYNNYFLWFSVSILIYWLGYLGVYHSGIFSQRTHIRSNNLKKVSSSLNKSSLNYSKFEEIDSVIKSNELYLNPDLSLDILSNEFNLSEGYLSQLINEFSQTNFSIYINKLRIEKSKEMLINNQYINYTIVAIALEAGFNSKSTFYNAFKKETNISPVQYKREKLS